MLAGVSRSHEKLLFFYITKNETKVGKVCFKLTFNTFVYC